MLSLDFKPKALQVFRSRKVTTIDVSVIQFFCVTLQEIVNPILTVITLSIVMIYSSVPYLSCHTKPLKRVFTARHELNAVPILSTFSVPKQKHSSSCQCYNVESMSRHSAYSLIKALNTSSLDASRKQFCSKMSDWRAGAASCWSNWKKKVFTTQSAQKVWQVILYCFDKRIHLMSYWGDKKCWNVSSMNAM